MDIKPIDIRKKAFDKKLRGYDKEEVNAFLNSLSVQWERILEEKHFLQERLKQAEKEVAKLREVEESLYKTLKTAEDTGASVVEQAKQTSALRVKEAELKADNIIKEARRQARTIIDEAETEAKNTFSALRGQVKELESEYNSIQNYRDNVINNLSQLTKEINDKTSRLSERKSVNFSAPIYQNENEEVQRFKQKISPLADDEFKVDQQKVAKEISNSSIEKESNDDQSFFDAL